MLISNAGYTPVEAFIYDRFIAPTVVKMAMNLTNETAASIKSGSEILDVGCGGGQFAIELASRRSDLSVTGLDLSMPQIRRARKRAASSGVNAVFVEGNAMKLPFENERFDIIISTGCIKHWPDKIAGLHEGLRVLKQGGVMIIAEVDKNCPAETAASFIPDWRIPRIIKSGAVCFFLKMIAGRSIGIEDALKMAASIPVSKADAELIFGGLFWIMLAVK